MPESHPESVASKEEKNTVVLFPEHIVFRTVIVNMHDFIFG